MNILNDKSILYFFKQLDDPQRIRVVYSDSTRLDFFIGSYIEIPDNFLKLSTDRYLNLLSNFSILENGNDRYIICFNEIFSSTLIIIKREDFDIILKGLERRIETKLSKEAFQLLLVTLDFDQLDEIERINEIIKINRTLI